MIIHDCPPGLTPQQKKEWKRLLVVQWLMEFKFSSIEVLSILLKQQPKHTAPFFKSMIDDKFLMRFSSEFYPKKDLVRLGPGALQWFPDLDQSLLRSDRHSTKKTLVHDHLVQRVIAERLGRYSEIDASFDRVRKEAPDAFVVSRKTGDKLAVEYELTRKNRDRTWALFIRYAKAIEAREVDAVIFYFRSKPMYRLYKKRFEAASWDTFKKTKKNGKTFTDRIGSFEPSAEIRPRFIFRLDLPKTATKDKSLSKKVKPPIQQGLSEHRLILAESNT